jgi:flavodoxin
MKVRKALVVFYSRSGTTRALAEALARTVDADLEEIVDKTGREGALGFFRSVLDAKLGRATAVEPRRHDPADYELVLIGTPVWASAVSAPVRAYLEDNRKRFRSVAFFVTEAGRGGERALSQMACIAGKEPTATLTLSHRDVVRTVAPMNEFVVKARGEPVTVVPIDRAHVHAASA